MDNLTQRITTLREAKNISKAEMSRILELDPSNYSKYEKIGRDWTINQLEKIAGALGVSVVELLTGEPQTSENDELVKELEKTVENLKKGIDDFSISIDVYLDSLVMKQAISSRSGKLSLYVDGGERIEFVDLSEIPKELDLDNWLESKYPNSYHAEEINLSYEEEKELIRKIMVKQKGLADILLVVRRLIKHEAWIDILAERIERKSKPH